MLLLAVLAAAPLHFHFDASEFTNAVYTTACLAARISCTAPVYERFWNSKMNPAPEDSKRFDGFREIFEKVERDAELPQPPVPFLPDYLAYYPSLRLRVKLMAAALRSKSPGDFRRRVAVYTNPEQADRLARIVTEVEDRLHSWWISTGQPIAQSRLKNAARIIARQGAPEMIRQVAAFLEVREGAPDVYIHLIPSPEYEGDQASANPTLNHFCVEINKEMDTAAAGWVAVHEETHALYDLAPEDKKRALMQQFADSTDPSAGPLYEYLNEAVATAVQLLLLERNGKKDDDPYREPFIPRLAQAALPLVREALNRKTTLYRGFAGPYITAGRKHLGPDADTIRFRFSSAVVLGDDELVDAFGKEISLKFWASTEENLKRFPRMPAIRVLSYQQAAAFAGKIGEVPEAGHRAFAVIRRIDQRDSLFLVGRDAAAIGELTRQLAARKEPSAEGIALILD